MIYRFVLTAIFIIFLFAQGSFAAPLIIKRGAMTSNRIELDVVVDGNARRFHLDTGANTSMVGLDAQSAKYISKSSDVAMGASGVVYGCDIIEPKWMVVDDHSVLKPSIRRCNFGNNNFDNLGLDFLSSSIVELDFDFREIHFLENVNQSKKSWDFETFARVEKGHVKLPVRIAQEPMYTIFDTGAEITSVDSKFVESHPEFFTYLSSQDTAKDISGNSLEIKFYKISELKIGRFKMRNLTVMAFDFGSLRDHFGEDAPLILGANAIIQADWLFDFKVNKWAVLSH